MKNLIISSTSNTPSIYFNEQKGLLRIEGESFNEYTSTFYSPVILWLDTLLLTEGRHLVLSFKLVYFNTSSYRKLLEILKKLEGYSKDGKGSARVKWHYEKGDDDILEAGTEIADYIDLPFEFIAEDRIS